MAWYLVKQYCRENKVYIFIIGMKGKS